MHLKPVKIIPSLFFPFAPLSGDVERICDKSRFTLQKEEISRRLTALPTPDLEMCVCVCVFQCQPTALLHASGSAQGG